MDRLLATCSMMLPDGTADAPVPEWLHLLPMGRFSGRDGRGPWRLTDPAPVIAATASELPLPLDEAHATDMSLTTGQPHPARGWVRELEARPDGIWGRVEWTPSGRALMEERAYKGVSPVYSFRKADGEVLQLLRAALTNVPNLPQLATLNSQDPHHMDLLAQLRELHGLGADADAAAVIAACQGAHGRAQAHDTALNSIASAAGLGSGADASAIVSALNGRKDQGEVITALQSQLSELQNERAKERAALVVDGAIRDGKPIPKDLRDHYIARHCQDPGAVEKELRAMPSLHGGGITAPPAGDDVPADAHGIARQAQELQDNERKAGRDISFAAAVQSVTRKNAG